MASTKDMAAKTKVVKETFKSIKIDVKSIGILAIIIMAFIIGRLTQKVEDLQGGNTQTFGTTANATVSPTAPTPAAKVNVGLGNFPAKGNANAKVTIVEFADFRCPFCEQFFTQTEPQIIKDYVNTGKAKLVFRNYAFLGPASTVAANAVECANDQGKFWEFHDYLYKNQPPETDTSIYNTDTLTKAATSLGMDGGKFSNCLGNKTNDAKVQQDFTEGQAAGVTGTPDFFVNGTPLIGAQPYSVFQQTIEAALRQ